MQDNSNAFTSFEEDWKYKFNFKYSDSAHHSNVLHSDRVTQIIEKTCKACNREVELEDIRRNFDINNIPSVDQVELEKLTKQFGAKAAHTEMTKRFIETLPDFYMHMDEILDLQNIFKIPDYNKISVEMYKKWLNNENIDQALQQFYEWTRHRDMMVRSSAVYSEDGEDATGAGVYESIRTEKGASFEEFKDAVIQVYQSVDSPDAIEYRKQNNIEYEEMGILLMEYQDADLHEINSIVKNRPQIMSMKRVSTSEYDFRSNYLKKDKILNTAVTDSPSYTSRDVGYPKAEGSFCHIHKVGIITELLTQYYGGQLQLEVGLHKEAANIFVWGEKPNYLYQNRPLPKNFNEPLDTQWPKLEAIFEGSSLGVFDGAGEILSNRYDNSGKHGMVIFASSHGATSHIFSSDRIGDKVFPKSGAVMILGPTPGNEGNHIAFRAAARGLAVIFNEDPNHPYLKENEISIHDASKNSIGSLGGYSTVRWVGDSIDGKVYGIEKTFN